MTILKAGAFRNGKTILKKKIGEAEVEIKVSNNIFKHFTDEEIVEKYKISLEIVKGLREQYNKKQGAD